MDCFLHVHGGRDARSPVSFAAQTVRSTRRPDRSPDRSAVMAEIAAETTTAATAPWSTSVPTALLVLADGTVIEGRGLGATGIAVAEVCFNTSLTGYEE